MRRLSTAEPATMIGESNFSVAKSRRKVTGEAVSQYILTDKRSGEVFYFSSEHKPKKPSANPIKARRDAYYPRNGAYAIVKKLEPSNKIGQKFKHAFALKCYLPTSDKEKLELETQLPRITAAYNQMGITAFAFKHRKKLFLAMEWMGNHDLLTTMQERAFAPMSNKQFMQAFYRFLNRLQKFHAISHQPIVDIKPENMFAVFDKSGLITDFRLADCDAAFASTHTCTPSYLCNEDVQILLKYGELITADFKTDYRVIANVLAVLSNQLVCREDLIIGHIQEILSVRMIKKNDASKEKEFRAVRLRIDRPKIYGHKHKDPLEKQATVDTVTLLQEGRSPLEEPTMSIVSYQLRSDLGYLDTIFRLESHRKISASCRITHNPLYLKLQHALNAYRERICEATTVEALSSIQSDLCTLLLNHTSHDTKHYQQIIANTFIGIQLSGTSIAKNERQDSKHGSLEKK